MNVAHNPSPEQSVGARRQSKGMNPRGPGRIRGEQGAGAPSSQVVTGHFTALSKEQVG